MKQFAIIGMGNFGRYLAINLYEKGHDVLAIDKRSSLIQDVKDHVSQALVADATDIETLESIGLKEIDTAIVCIGENLSNSILTTLNLNDIGVKKIYAKADNESHARILKKTGAHEIFFPEKDQAILLGEKMHDPNLLEYLPFIKGYSIIQLPAPKQFLNKTLRELNLINEFGVQVVAIEEKFPKKLNVIPTATFKLKESDTMIILGPDEALDKLKSEDF